MDNFLSATPRCLALTILRIYKNQEIKLCPHACYDLAEQNIFSVYFQLSLSLAPVMSDYVDGKVFCVFYTIIISFCPDNAWGVNIGIRLYKLLGWIVSSCTVWNGIKRDAVIKKIILTDILLNWKCQWFLVPPFSMNQLIHTGKKNHQAVAGLM